ncbi:hypothetical protein JCM8097_009462 [Rhodosporidiobolus ruineniae]
MRIISWNVGGAGNPDGPGPHGLRALHLHPSWKDQSCEQILEGLGGDIICLQETKLLPDKMDRSMAFLSAYDSFFSHNASKNPYSPTGSILHGTATFTKRESVVPVKAEEGVGSSRISHVPVPQRIGAYPQAAELGLDFERMKELDCEGRATVVDTGLFVLLNIYGPNISADNIDRRLPFKNDFDNMLDQRVRNLIAAGREVIIVGDLNITVGKDDQSGFTGTKTAFAEYEPRQWLYDFVGDDGPMVDIMRVLHPHRQMFTHGSQSVFSHKRLDYILLTPGLRSWVASADLLPLVRGSDHTAIYLDLHSELDIPGRGKVSLWEELNPGRKKGDPLPDPPAFAARLNKDLTKKQTAVTSFFGASRSPSTKGASPPTAPAAGPSAAKSAPSPSTASPSNSLFIKPKLAHSGSSASASSTSKGLKASPGKKEEKAKKAAKEVKAPAEKKRKTGPAKTEEKSWCWPDTPPKAPFLPPSSSLSASSVSPSSSFIRPAPIGSHENPLVLDDSDDEEPSVRGEPAASAGMGKKRRVE